MIKVTKASLLLAYVKFLARNVDLKVLETLKPREG